MERDNDNIIIGVIPSYQPEDKLINLVRDIIASNFLQHIIVVDDGSKSQYADIYQQLDSFPNVSVVHLAVNSGTGAAIKYGIQHSLYLYPNLKGIVTFDADGQHLPSDIKKVTEKFFSSKSDIVLGLRDFHSSQIKIPLRSKFGNLVTEFFFWLATGVHITDTQTGLRCYSPQVASVLTQILQNRYEFQLQALLLAVTEYRVSSVPIETVYEDGNRCSHFNPVRDSLRIYAVLLKFMFSSLASSIVDYFVFSFLFLLSANILTSLLIARIISVTFNFIINYSCVFKSKGNIWGNAIQFALLAVMLFLGSYFGITFLKNTCSMSPLVSKIIVEIILFILSYIVQRFLIFPVISSKERSN